MRNLALLFIIFMTDNGTADPWYPKEGKDHSAGLRGIEERNVLAENPEAVAKQMKACGEWWSRCSERAGTLVPITVGHAAENPAFLAAHDWHGRKFPGTRKSLPKLRR